MASDLRLVVSGSRRVRRLLRHERVPEPGEQHGAAVAVLAYAEPVHESREPAEPGDGVPDAAEWRDEHVRARSEFPDRVCAELAGIGTEGPAGRQRDHGDVLR